MTLADWNPDYLDLAACLAAEKAEFLVVGAFALAEYGLPRATGDFDVLVRPTGDNAARVLSALRRFGAPLGGVTEGDLARPGTVFQIGVTPRRIAILTELSGVAYDEAWANRLEREVHGRRLSFLGEETFIKNKRSSGRPKDLVDADAVERLRARRRP